MAAAGAEAAIDYSSDSSDWPGQVLAATGNQRPRLVLDGVGGRLGEMAYTLVADGGGFSRHGAPGGGFAQVDRADAARRGITVIGLEDLQTGPGERAERLRSLLPPLAAGRLAPHIGQTWPLADARAAHAAIEGRRTVAKSLLTVDR